MNKGSNFQVDDDIKMGTDTFYPIEKEILISMEIQPQIVKKWIKMIDTILEEFLFHASILILTSLYSGLNKSTVYLSGLGYFILHLMITKAPLMFQTLINDPVRESCDPGLDMVTWMNCLIWARLRQEKYGEEYGVCFGVHVSVSTLVYI